MLHHPRFCHFAAGGQVPIFEKAKEGVPRRVKFDPFANSSGYSSMNKVSKKQEPCGGPRRRKQVMYSKILEVSKEIVDSQSKV